MLLAYTFLWGGAAAPAAVAADAAKHDVDASIERFLSDDILLAEGGDKQVRSSTCVRRNLRTCRAVAPRSSRGDMPGFCLHRCLHRQPVNGRGSFRVLPIQRTPGVQLPVLSGQASVCMETRQAGLQRACAFGLHACARPACPHPSSLLAGPTACMPGRLAAETGGLRR